MAQFVTSRKKVNAGIDMTPLIDVVFQLLIFLMVSSHFVKPDAKVELPSGKSEASEVSQVEKQLILITADNKISINGSEVSLETFEKVLEVDIQNTGVDKVELRGDKAADLGVFIEVVEMVKSLGVEDLSYHKQVEKN